MANKLTVHGLTVDSGGGTPESLKAELTALEWMYEANLFCERCSLHDMMSVIHLPHVVVFGDIGEKEFFEGPSDKYVYIYVPEDFCARSNLCRL